MADDKQTPQTTHAPPKMKAEISKNIEPGEHKGEIVRASYEQRGEQKFPYLDVVIREDESGVELKAGYPANRVTDRSAIGLLLARFGFNVREAADKELDVDWSVLKGRVLFTTTIEENSKGKFARVDQDSVRPDAPAPRRR